MAPELERLMRLLEKRGALPAQGPEDAQQAWKAQALRQRRNSSSSTSDPGPGPGKLNYRQVIVFRVE